MKRFLIPVIALLALGLFALQPASGALISRYEFASTYAPTVYASNVTVSSLGVSAFDIKQNNETGKEIDLSSESGAPHLVLRDLVSSTSTHYTGTITFNITPTSSYQISYDTLMLYASMGNSDGITMVLSYKVGSGSWVEVGTHTPTGVSSPGTQTVAKDSYNISALQNVSETVYFEIALAGNDGAIGNYDDIAVNGAVSLIPEPASLALLGLGGLMLLPRRRM